MVKSKEMNRKKEAEKKAQGKYVDWNAHIHTYKNSL